MATPRFGSEEKIQVQCAITPLKQNMILISLSKKYEA